MTAVCFYGHFSGWSSYPQACKRLARHLLEQGVDLGLVNLRGVLIDDPHLEGVPVGDAKAPIGLYHGFADGLVRVPRHKRMVGYHVGDVDTIPASWVTHMNRLDLVITQSSWCRYVFDRCGVRVPVHLSRAGVDEACVPGPERAPHSPLRVAHFNSSPEWWRKGTAEVIVAMQKLAGTLPIRVEVHTGSETVRNAITRANAPGLVLADRHEPLLPAAMADLLRSYDLLLAPSRAEGLGLLPIEALACGLPAVATATCTGHTETLSPGLPGLISVPVSSLTPCGSFGRAPSLSPDAVAEGLRQAVVNYPDLSVCARANASAIARKWRWGSILEADRFAQLVLSR